MPIIKVHRNLQGEQMTKHKIRAVHDSELTPFLRQTSLLSRMESNVLKCHYCGDVINEDNLQAIVPKEEDLHVVCLKSECLRKMYESA